MEEEFGLVSGEKAWVLRATLTIKTGRVHCDKEGEALLCLPRDSALDIKSLIIMAEFMGTSPSIL